MPVFRKRLVTEIMPESDLNFAPGIYESSESSFGRKPGRSAYYEEGKTETAVEHQPDYLRVSQAERERAERERAKQEAR